MNFKRILSLLLCLVMIASCLFSLAACGDKECTEHIDEDKDGKCDVCDAEMPKDPDTPPGKTKYTINVITLGGMALEGVTVYVYNAAGTIASLPKTTDEAGNATFELDTASGYTIFLDGVPKGYNVKSGESAEERYPMNTTGAKIILSSKPVTEGSLAENYQIGDVMYDFSINDIDGNTYKLSQLLENKRMVMLNFWYIDCSACNKEFPTLNDAYANYKDKLEILAINDYASDSAAEIKEFPTTGSYKDDNLIFPMFNVKSGSNNLTIDKFGSFSMTGYPTTVIIDRYGVICMIEQGAIVGEAKWNKIFDHFTSDTYVQRLVEKAEDLTPPEKPDIAWGGSDGIAANLSSADITVSYAPDDDEYSWPFIPDTVEGVNVVRPSNKSDNSYAILYANIDLKPGQAVMFDYFSSCEYGSDKLYVIVEDNDICALTGKNTGDITDSNDWEMCCAYVDPRPITQANQNDVKTYKVAFAYIKDTEGADGDDTVYLKNLKVVSVDDITVETYIIRDAVSDAVRGGFDTYVNYTLGSDGYYHVLNADNTEGPLLLVDFLGYTNFDNKQTVSQRIMNDYADGDTIMVGDVDKYNTWMVYANASSNATIYGHSPVTPELKEILDVYCRKYMNTVSKNYHDELWLQLCVYYDAYGQDELGNPTKPVENPIKGLTTFSAFETDFPANPAVGHTESFTVTYDRVIMPRGLLYKFTPKTSGVYRITSNSNIEVHGWIFTGTSLEWMSTGTQERDVLVDFEEEERYCPDLHIPQDGGGFVRDTNNVSLVAYMEAGTDYYIDIAYYDIYAEGSFDFDIKYEGTELDVFVKASPGPITYFETATGGIGGLIALGIDYDFKVDPVDGITYAYQVLERDANDVPTVWGEKLYADFYNPTTPFPSQSLKELAEIGAFNFSISATDRDAMIYLKQIRNDGKDAIITEWVNSQVANPNELWTSKGLDDILLAVQSGADVSSYNADDVATAIRAISIGEFKLKREFGIEAVGTEEDWKALDMDNALSGNYSQDEDIRLSQTEAIDAINTTWNEIYQMDEVARGIYHGVDDKNNPLPDMSEKILEYIALMEDETYPEREGCVAVTEELAEILHLLYEKYNFEDAKHDFLKFCFYYKHLGPAAE